MSWPWSQLGLPGPSGLSEIRHAYAEKLKTTHPEEDPEGFQQLHSAYQLASRIARQQKRRAEAQVPAPEHPPQSVSGPSRLPEQDFDFDGHLQEDGGHGRPLQEQEPDWDYDRLIAEGAAERAEDRRRRGEERRRGSQERQRQWEERPNLRPHQEQDRWHNTETILRIMEMMYNSQAGIETWKDFFQSPLFLQSRDSLDLMFGLEDFVSSRRLSQEVGAALFLAYGFDKGISRPEQQPLFRMLLPAWKADRKVKGFPWKLMLLGYLGGLVFLFGIGPLLDSGLIPIFLYAAGLSFIVWVVRKAILLGNQEGRARGRHISKKQEQRSLVLAIACVMALVVGLSLIRSLPGLDRRGLTSARDPREQVCCYIEEDTGIKVGALYNLDASHATDTYGNVFYLDSDPDGRQFLAGPDGGRDMENDRPGYTTNLPEMMMLWALEDFAAEQGIDDVDALDRELGLERWETSGSFRLSLPDSAPTEAVTDLGALLEELSRQPWYQARPPVCEIVLYSGEIVLARLRLN